MDFNLVLGAGIAVLVLYFLLKATAKPLSKLGKVLLRSAICFFLIWVVNVIGGFAGFHMGLNPLSAVTVGVLGIPGAGLLLALKYLL